MASLKIVEEKNIIDDHLLDIIGNEFKFDHEKGLAEWLKNSVDAYITADIPDAKQYVVIRMSDGTNNDAVMEVVDFVGMDETHIDKAFKRWGDPEAAKRGLNKRVYGGHGNGGKFYMRQMFESSHFVTYKNGILNIFGFSENKKYGFADGYKGKHIKSAEAIKVAGIAGIYFPDDIKKLILDGKRGFTVVRGIGPESMRNKIRYPKLMGRFRNHSQARRILSRASVWASHNDQDYLPLKPDELKPMVGFEQPHVIDIPEKLKYMDDGEESVVPMVNQKYQQPGKLILRTSEEALARGSRLGDLNRIDIVGEIGVIASYQLSEIGVSIFPQASFIYGECEAPILEDPDMDSVKNDRTKLVENARSKALLEWIRAEADKFANEIVSKEKAEQTASQKKISAAFNDYLNKWKDRFMNKIMGDLGQAGGMFGGDPDEDHGKRKILDVPEGGLAFSYPFAEIIAGEEKKITLKASCPEPIPVGSIISLGSENSKILPNEKEITIKNDDLRLSADGQSVAVLNVFVSSSSVGAEGNLVAKVGKMKAEILLRVIEANSADKSKKPKAPRILLSGTDTDPLGISPDGMVTLTERNPLVYQRIQDVAEGIYWINTQSPLAKAILEKYADHSVRWRDYLFQRYIDIFVKQIIHELQKKDPDGFKADSVDNALDMKIMQIHALAMSDLGKFFFDETFVPSDKENEK